MHKQYSCLVQVKAKKRLGNDQLESNNSLGGVLFEVIFWFDLSMELGIPNTIHFLVNDKWINTHCENNTSSMENIGHPSLPRELYEHTKEKFN